MRKIILLLLIISTKIYSQSIEGQIVSLNNKPISMAIVQLLQEDEVQTYAITSDDGKFFFKNLNKQIYTLSISHISYEKELKNIDLQADIKNLKIVLQEKISQLEQIEVQARAPLAQRKGDTLAYNLNAVTDGNERKLRDVLSKLPGVEINPITGKISANGKVIDEFLINGQKLFGKNHKLATENINAEMLDEISLITNYEKFSAVKEIEGSEKTAMNIKIKEAFLGKITGEAEVMGAYKNNYKLHPKLFQFNKKHSLSLIAKADNIGEEAMNLFDFIELNTGIKSDIRGGDLSQNAQGTQFPSFLLSNKNVAKKQNEFLSFYSVFQPKENWNINAYIIGNHSKINENSFSKKQFYSNDYLIEDSQTSKLHTYNVLSKINSEYYLDKNTMLNYSLVFSKNEANHKGLTINSLNGLSIRYLQTQNPNFITLGQQLSFIKKISRLSLFSLNAYHEFKQNNNFLDIEANTFLFDTNDVSFAQQTKEKGQELGAFAKYAHKISNQNTLTANTGFNALKQQIDYHKQLIINDFVNRDYLFTNVAFSHKKAKIEYGLAAELRHYLNENNTFFIPQAMAKYNFKENFHYIEARYNRDINFTNLLEINNVDYASNFRNYYLTSLLHKNAELLKDAYQLRYVFVDLYNGITLFAHSKYTENKEVITKNYLFSNNVNYITNRLSEGGFQWINMISLGVNLFKIKHKIDVLGSYNQSETPFYRNQLSDKMNLDYASAEFRLSSNFKEKKYNYVAGVKFSKTSNSTQNSQAISLTEYIPKIDVTATISEHLTAYLTHNYHIATSNGFDNRFWELNYKLFYQKLRSKWRFYLTAENFLNINGNKTLSSADRIAYFETQQIDRLAGFVGGGIIFDFK